MKEPMTVLDTIGRTRLIPLQHIVPEKSARILLKLEYENPTGSMKDRMALAMVEAAEADGRLRPGGSVVEYTGGSTGVSLALVCAAKRIPLQIVTSDAFSKEKRDHMTALGARLTLVASPTGGTTKALTLEMIETARRLASAPFGDEIPEHSVVRQHVVRDYRALGIGRRRANRLVLPVSR
jgi:cysteine synthase